MSEGPSESSGPEIENSTSRLCENCGTNNTIQWRTGGGMTLCNSCGIYFTRNKRHRSFKQNYPTFGIRAKQISFQLDTEASREQRKAREAAFPLEPQSHSPNLGKLSNIRRKQIELGLSHLYLRQQEQVQYYQRLSEAKPLSVDSLSTEELAACLASKLQSEPTNPHNTPEAINWLQSLQSTSFSNVKLKQMDLQLQHIPDKQLNEEKFHQRNQSASPLPMSAYIPYLGNELPVQPQNPNDLTSAYQIHSTLPLPSPLSTSSMSMEIDRPLSSSNFQQLQNIFSITDPLPNRHSYSKPAPMIPPLMPIINPLQHTQTTTQSNGELKYECVLPMNWWDLCSTKSTELQVDELTKLDHTMPCDSNDESWIGNSSLMEEGLEDSPFW